MLARSPVEWRPRWLALASRSSVPRARSTTKYGGSGRRSTNSARAGVDEEQHYPETDGRGSGRDSDHRYSANLPEGETRPEQEYQDYAASTPDSSEAPDVLLDVPVVKVDEINFDLEDLRARVSLQAEVLDLLKLNVGADVALGRVHLDMKGIEAQALLKVRLDNVAKIVDRVLTTIDRNPEILENITSGVGQAVEEVGEGAGGAVEPSRSTWLSASNGIRGASSPHLKSSYGECESRRA